MRSFSFIVLSAIFRLILSSSKSVYKQKKNKVSFFDAGYNFWHRIFYLWDVQAL